MSNEQKLNTFFNELFRKIDDLNNSIGQITKELNALKKYSEDVQESGYLEDEQTKRVRRLLNDIKAGTPNLS